MYCTTLQLRFMSHSVTAMVFFSHGTCMQSRSPSRSSPPSENAQRRRRQLASSSESYHV